MAKSKIVTAMKKSETRRTNKTRFKTKTEYVTVSVKGPELSANSVVGGTDCADEIRMEKKEAEKAICECGEILKNKETLTKHRRKHGKKFKCSHCSFQHVWRTSMVRHSEKVHKEEYAKWMKQSKDYQRQHPFFSLPKKSDPQPRRTVLEKVIQERIAAVLLEHDISTPTTTGTISPSTGQNEEIQNERGMHDDDMQADDGCGTRDEYENDETVTHAICSVDVSTNEKEDIGAEMEMNKKLIEKVFKLEKEIEITIKLLDAEKASVVEMEEKLRHHESRLEDNRRCSEKEIQGYKSHIENLNVELRSALEMADIKDKEVERLTCNLKSLEEKYDDVKVDSKQLSELRKSDAAITKTLRTKLTSSFNREMELKTTIEDLKARNAEADIQLVNEMKKLDITEKSLEAHKKQIRRLKIEKTKMAAQIQNLTAK